MASPAPKTGLWLAVGLLAGSFVVLYGPVMVKLFHDWGINENYSHGYLIPPIVAYLIWQRRDALLAVRPSPSLLGLVLVVLSTVVLLAGLLGAELFLTRMAMLGTVVGGVLWVLGWRHLRVLAFPLAMLLLMIPLPAIVFNQIVFPLQLIASRFGGTAVAAAGIPVLREGNVIILANTTLEVAEACSGIRSLVSLLTLAIVYGYFSDPRTSVRVAIALSSVPVAILANGLRVAGTGIAAHFYGAKAAQGFLHEFSGWVVFIAAFAMLFVVLRVLQRIAPDGADTPALRVPQLNPESR